jgi:phosphopantetheine--protein transferase-like protein
MVGIDIVDIKQVKGIYQRHGLLFLQKILTDQEIDQLPLKRNRSFFRKVGSFIAAKEAVFKACSQERLDWKEIFIYNIDKQPAIKIQRANFDKHIRLGLSVDRDIVLSQALVT